jgi:heme-degrading monooxygenase HmoA
MVTGGGSEHTDCNVIINTGGIRMFARMTRWEFEPSTEQVEKIIERNRDQVMPAARALPGFKGFYSLVDGEGGTAVTLTIWESAEAARGSDEMANRLRATTSQTTGITMISAERYDVAVHADSDSVPAGALPAS